jgi:hypothetical protein
MIFYSRRDIAVMAYAGGLLTGLILAFAACSPPATEPAPTTTIGEHRRP